MYSEELAALEDKLRRLKGSNGGSTTGGPPDGTMKEGATLDHAYSKGPDASRKNDSHHPGGAPGSGMVAAPRVPSAAVDALEEMRRMISDGEAFVSRLRGTTQQQQLRRVV